MRILHYFLGFPPYRTGGLTKFAYDLMQSQSEKGDSVIALWPGRIGLLNKKTSIKKRSNNGGIENYEIINPLPVPLDEGIQDFDSFTKSVNKEVYSVFLSSIHADAIHIHSLMGLHKEFIEAANDLKIKTVFTTHDYFGICPKVTLFRNGTVCEDAESCNSCSKCNISALSFNEILLMQSTLYKMLKNSYFVKKLRQKHREAYFEETECEAIRADEVSVSEAYRYKQLRSYYMDMLENISLIHFNSTVSEKVYKQFIIPKNSIVLSISNREIKGNEILDKIPSDKMRFTYLSPAKTFKGYNFIKNTFDRLWNEGRRDFVLNLYTKVPKVEPYMNIHENGFRRDELPEIFSNTDYLLAPSIWYETFGFTVLEALNYGIPVIISDRVGAKDIVGDCGVVIDTCDKNSLYMVLNNNELPKFTGNTQIFEWEDFLIFNNNNY